MEKPQRCLNLRTDFLIHLRSLPFLFSSDTRWFLYLHRLPISNWCRLQYMMCSMENKSYLNSSTLRKCIGKPQLAVSMLQY